MEKTILVLCILSANIYTSLAASQSECTSGQKWDGAKCVACDQGTYQDQSAQTSCINCPTGTYNANTGSTSSSACTKCPLGTSNANQGSKASTDCANCATGYYTSSTGLSTCDICNQGYYKDSATNTCKDCKDIGYQPSVGQSSCVQCPTGSITSTVGPISSTNCDTCTKGYYKSGSSCVACPVGEYSDANGATTCKKCSAVTDKKDSTTKAEASMADTDCLCKKGYYYNKNAKGEKCIMCANLGEYKETVSDDAECKKCNATYGTGSTTVSEDVANTALSACVCGPGYYGTTTCTPCPDGEYNDVYGQIACTKCPAYLGRTTSSTDTDPKTSVDKCNVCDKGYYGDVGTATCTACPAGTYKPEADTAKTDANACNACTADATVGGTTYKAKTNSGTINAASTAQTACVCNKGYYKESDTVCTKCSKGNYKDVMSDATSCTACPSGSETTDTASTSSSDCLCSKGYYLSSGSCLQCAIGTYQNELAKTSCKKCNPGKTTTAVGKTAAGDCTCAAGYATDKCIACDIGYYKTTTGTGTCTQCATERTTLSIAQTDISACVCKPGYYLSGTTCTVCAVGSYSTAANSTACTTCPTGLTTLSTGSDSASDCVCKAGYYTSNTATTPVTCAQCAKGSYNANTNQNSCELCTSGLTTASTGSTASSDCITSSSPGNFGNSSGSYPCAVGTYQDQSDQSSCTSCSTGATTSSTGSTSSTACICNVGYAGTANSCTACYYNTYQDTTGQAVCKQCGSDQVTNTMGSTASSQCVDDNNSTTTRVGKFTITSLTYVSDYGSSGTTSYMTLYTALATELNKVYSSKSTTFSRVSSMEFSSGSVKAEYDIIFNGDADLTNSELEDALKNSLTSGNNLGAYTIDTSTIDVSDKGLGWAAILGIVLGCLAFVVIVLVVVVVCCYYCNNRERYGDRYSRGGGRPYGAYSNRGYSNMQNYKNFDRQGRVPPTMDPGYKNPPQAIPRPGYPDSMGSEKGMNMPNPNLYHWRNSNGWPNYDYGQFQRLASNRHYDNRDKYNYVTGRREPQTGFDRKNDHNLNKDARPPQPRNRVSQMQNNNAYNMNPYRAYQMDDRQGNLY